MKTCLWVLLAASLHAQEPCAVTQPTATFEIHHTADPGELSLDPQAAMWKNAAHAWIVKDCSKKKDYPNLKTEVRAFWTDTDIYFLFVSPDDKHLRAVLSRWAHTAGWTFEAEHWVVDADIPIVGSAHFESGFKLAVQDLVASTELADRPLQPCFYSNRVLRIVPYAQLCDRTANLSESS